jgi:RNA polymerase sigma-70 factor (ECF subfamily)
MNEHDWLVDHFEAKRPHLQAVAYRMLGSRSEADDAVQEAWLRCSRAGTTGVENVGGWLTTIVARVCLDLLRARTARREESLDAQRPDSFVSGVTEHDPEHAALLADGVGVALLVVLDTLAPAERLAFVLHDIFALPFDQIAPIVGRSPDAARKLASRARQRVHGASTGASADLASQRTVVDAFLAAAREGNFAALLAVLDPDIVFRADPAAVALGGPRDLRGATAVAKQFAGRAQAARPALVNGAVGVAVVPHGHLLLVLHLTIAHGKIAAIAVVAEPTHLQHLAVVVLDDLPGG